MPDVSKINGYDIKDKTSRADITAIKNGTTKVGAATNADNATKATQDGSGNNIVSTYATKSELAGISGGGSNPNLLLNPDFRVNQRGGSVYSANSYTLDRWEFWYGGTGGNVTKSSVGYISLNCGSDTSKYAQITQMIDLEDIPLEVGEYYTLSMEYAESVADANAGNWKRVNEASVITKGSAIPWIWTKSNDTAIFFAWSGNIPYVKIQTKSSIWVHWVKLEKGQTATEFIPPIYSEELLKCQRYYYESRSGLGFILPITQVNNTTTDRRANFQFPVTMRRTPTVTVLATIGSSQNQSLNTEFVNPDSCAIIRNGYTTQSGHQAPEVTSIKADAEL